MATVDTTRARPPATPAYPAGGEQQRRRLPASFESIAIFVLFAVAFIVLGYLITIQRHVVVFDALDRLTRAYMVWYNDPPKLAAIGFSFPPITTVVFLPFAVIKPVATSGMALVLMTSAFAAGTMVVLNRAFTLVGLTAALRYLMLLAIAVNPMIAFYSTNGQSDMVGLFFLAAGLYCFMAWFDGRQPRYLIGAGMAFSLALLTRYEFIADAFLLAVLIAAALAAQRVRRDEIEGSVIGYLAPIIYALTLWIFFNLVIVGDPFGWLESIRNPVVNSPAGITSGGHPSIGDVITKLVEINFGIFPLTLLILPVLLIAFFAQRDYVALAFALLILINLIITGASAFTANDLGTIELRDALPAMMIAILGAAWLVYSFEGAGIGVYVAALALAVIAIPLSYSQMKTYPFQNLEQAFARAVTTGKDQEGTVSRGGYIVGTKPEELMANFIKRTTNKKNNVLTDNSQTFAVILLNGRPPVFFDRVDKGDAQWKKTLNRPATGKNKVQYFLVSRSRADLIGQRYPSLRVGRGNQFFQPVFKTDRYTIYRVRGNPPLPRAARTAAGGGGTTGGGTGLGETGAAPAVPGEAGRTGGTSTTQSGTGTSTTQGAQPQGALP